MSIDLHSTVSQPTETWRRFTSTTIKSVNLHTQSNVFTALTVELQPQLIVSSQCRSTYTDGPMYSQHQQSSYPSVNTLDCDTQTCDCDTQTCDCDTQTCDCKTQTCDCDTQTCDCPTNWATSRTSPSRSKITTFRLDGRHITSCSSATCHYSRSHRRQQARPHNSTLDVDILSIIPRASINLDHKHIGSYLELE